MSYDQQLATSSVACAWCGTREGLWDEGDTLYCTPCAKRTWIATGERALRRCQNCKQMADAKAYYCTWCNTTKGSS